MQKGIREDCPGLGEEGAQRSRYRQLMVDKIKYLRMLGNCRAYKKNPHRQKNHHIDDDQLYMAVIVTLKSVFKFFQHT